MAGAISGVAVFVYVCGGDTEGGNGNVLTQALSGCVCESTGASARLDPSPPPSPRARISLSLRW
jgi:hypothetical protein